MKFKDDTQTRTIPISRNMCEQQKLRNPNFTNGEVGAFITLLGQEPTKTIIFSSFGPHPDVPGEGITQRLQNKTWDAIAAKLHAQGGAKRTGGQWRTKKSDLFSKVKVFDQQKNYACLRGIDDTTNL